MSNKTNIGRQSATPPISRQAEKGKKPGEKTAIDGKSLAGVSLPKDAALADPAVAPLAKTKSPKATAGAGVSAVKAAKKSVPAKAPAVKSSAPPVASKTPPKTASTAARGPKAPAVVQAPPPIQDDEIARLAYSYSEARGFRGGSPDADWFRAKEELLRLRGAKQ